MVLKQSNGETTGCPFRKDTKRRKELRAATCVVVQAFGKRGGYPFDFTATAVGLKHSARVGSFGDLPVGPMTKTWLVFVVNKSATPRTTDSLAFRANTESPSMAILTCSRRYPSFHLS